MPTAVTNLLDLAWMMKSAFRIFFITLFVYYWQVDQRHVHSLSLFGLSASLKASTMSLHSFQLQRVSNRISGAQWVHILRWYKFVINTFNSSFPSNGTVKLWTYFLLSCFIKYEHSNPRWHILQKHMDKTIYKEYSFRSWFHLAEEAVWFCQDLSSNSLRRRVSRS